MTRSVPPARRWIAGAFVLTLVLAFPRAAAAQREPISPLEGWLARFDDTRAGPSELEFMDMPPGWHVTTGPAGIIYRPATTAAGDFRVEAEVFLFDPAGNNEGFGVFVGGADLQGPDQAYTSFVIRADGSALVKRRDGSSTAILQDWTPREAVVAWAERGPDAVTVRNAFFVEAAGAEVAFGVNGQEVFRAARDGLPVDGIVGLRVDQGLNLHVSSLEVKDD